MLSAFVWAWNKRVLWADNSQRESSVTPTISVVVACRNEAKNLPLLLGSFISQELQADEFILIDDNSTDETFDILNTFAEKHSNVLVQKSEGVGKKMALRQAILAAKSELILCTDADCSVPKSWVQQVSLDWKKSPFDLLILPVEMIGNDTLFTDLQRMEFATLVASGGSAANLGHAIICNGANLAFRKTSWLECAGELHDELPTGDDVFLLHALKKRKAIIRFLSEKKACVKTQACTSLSEFFSQRARWVSKAPAYTDKDTIVLACIVFVTNIWMLFLFVGMFFLPSFPYLYFLFFFSKWISDAIFLMRIRSLFALKNLLSNSFLLSLLYPIYVLLSVCKSLKKERKP